MLSQVIADLLAGDRGYRVIQQLPGIGPVLAAVITAEIGDVTRFRNAAQLCSQSGLTPRHRESGTKVARGHVTKQGSRLLRFLSALAVFGGTRVAVGLRCWEADPFHMVPQQAAARRR
jgi:transposase